MNRRDKRYFYTRRDRHHFLARIRKYRNTNMFKVINGARGGIRIGLIIFLVLLSVGLFLIPMNHINDEADMVFIPIGTAPPRDAP